MSSTRLEDKWLVGSSSSSRSGWSSSSLHSATRRRSPPDPRQVRFVGEVRGLIVVPVGDLLGQQRDPSLRAHPQLPCGWQESPGEYRQQR